MQWDSPFLTAYILGIAAVLGLVFGSFLNALAYRQVHGGSVLRGRSVCDACGHVLSARDLAPLFSYLLLGGRCRYCGAKIPARCLLTEALAALYFVSVVYGTGLSEPILTLKYLVMGCLLLVAALVDCDTYTISDRLVFRGVVLALLLCGGEWKDALTGAIIVSVPLFFFVLLADRVVGRETMGGGDIKLFFMTGAFLGPGLTVLCLISSCLCGILIYGASSLIRRWGGAAGSVRAEAEAGAEAGGAGAEPAVGAKSQNDAPGPGGPGDESDDAGTEPGLAFAPAIACGAWFCIIFGDSILTWYFGLF